MRLIIKTAACLFLIFGIIPSNLVAEDFALNPTLNADTVIFESDAKLEFIEGITTDVIGKFTFDLDNPAAQVSGVIRADLRTMHTGIETRDEDMRKDYLHTDKYPYAYFELVSLNNMPDKISFDTKYEVNGYGYFYIHGVKRELYPMLSFEVSKAGDVKKVKVLAEFKIKLDEYKIKRPKLILYKLAETMNLNVIFTAYSDALKPDIKLPDYKELE